jgi:hypothetical protein
MKEKKMHLRTGKMSTLCATQKLDFLATEDKAAVTCHHCLRAIRELDQISKRAKESK